MRALEHLVVGRERQAALDEVSAFGLVLGEAPHEDVDWRLLEVVDGPLPLALAVDVAPCDAGRPLEVEGALLPLQEHRQPLEPVRDLGRDQVELEPAELLEVRELRHLHAVHPDLPAKPPRTERGPLPVVLDEADVVSRQVDADRLEGAEVEVEHVLGRGLQDHLVLEVVLEPERVLAVPAVRRADRRLNVGGPPLRRSEATEERRRVEGSRPDLRVVRLHDDAAVVGPVALQAGDHLLVGRRSHRRGHATAGARPPSGPGRCPAAGPA